MKSKLTASAALLLAVALGYFYFQAAAQRQLREAELAAARAELDRLQSEADAVKHQQLPDSELARLKSDQAEAVKLRNEAAALKQTLANSRSNIAAVQKTSASQNSSEPTKPALVATPEIRTFNSKVAARLPSGHGLAIGGWQTAPGKRSFAILLPNAIATPQGEQQVHVFARWIEVSDDAAAHLQLDTLLNSSGEQSALLTADSLPQFLKSIETTEGAKLVASPRVIANSGHEATVAVTSSIQTPNGPISIGPQISITPTVAPDGSTIDLAVNATLTLNTKDSPSN
jgi:hypothetical protein